MPRKTNMADSQLLTIVLIASVACVILYRLYTVLGRRTGHERPPQENYPLGARQAENAVGAPAKISHISPDRPSDPVASGLFDIGLAARDCAAEGTFAGEGLAGNRDHGLAFVAGDGALAIFVEPHRAGDRNIKAVHRYQTPIRVAGKEHQAVVVVESPTAQHLGGDWRKARVVTLKGCWGAGSLCFSLHTS